MKTPRSRPGNAADPSQNGDRTIGIPAMFAALVHKFRRWIGYRPERRYMRGNAKPG